VSGQAVTDHAAAISRNLAYWREQGPAAVRRDHELADEAARADIKREAEYSAGSSWRRRLGEALQVGSDRGSENITSTAAAAHPAVDSVTWYDDQGFYAGPEVGAEFTQQDRNFAFSAEGVYLALCREKTGDTAPDDRLDKWRLEAAELLEQTHAIAGRMESAGWKAYRECPFDLWRYYIHSGHVEKMPNFRRSMILPHMAQSVRAPMLAALESFLERWTFTRFWTFTSGPRVKTCEVRRTAEQLHRRISKLNGEAFMKAAGAEIVFRSTELGTPEELEVDANSADWKWTKESGTLERDGDGQVCFHVHAHCLVILKNGRISKKRWRRLLRRVRSHWKHHWRDGSEDKPGPIRNARECCKYICKPGEMLQLAGAELVALQAQLERLKLTQPMGILADEIRARRPHVDAAGRFHPGKRLVRKRTPDGPVYREVVDWNKHGRKTESEKTAEAAAKLDRPPARKDEVRILARQLPRIGPAGVAEPTVTVMCRTWDEKEVRSTKVVSNLIRRTAHEFWAGHAIKVHTRTATVGANLELSFAAKLDPPRLKPSGAELSGFAR